MTAGALSLAFRSPVLQLDKEKEADELASAIAKVMRHYGDIPGLNEKTLDWLALFYTSAIIVGPRVAVAAANRKKAQAETPEPANIAPQQTKPGTVKIPGVGEVEVPMQ